MKSSVKSSKNSKSLFNRIFNWSEAHEGLTTLLIAIFVITTVLGARSAILTYTAYCGRETAKTYVGQRTFTNAKWWMFQGRVELFEANQTDGQGLSVPVNTEFGSKISSEFLTSWTNEPRDPNLQLPITVKITYDEKPQNTSPESSSTRAYLEGAYLHFEIASPPPSSNSRTQTTN